MTRVIALLIGLLLLVPVAWASDPEVVELQVTGMTCPFCVYGTEKNLKKLPGVEKVDVSLDKKVARIEMTPGQTADMQAIRKAITDAGFTPGEILSNQAVPDSK